MKFTLILLFGIFVACNCSKIKEKSNPKLKNLWKYFLQVIKPKSVKNKSKLQKVIPFDGIPKNQSELKKGVTTWPLDYFLFKDSVPKNLLKFFLTMLIFKKVFVFIGLLILLFLAPAALTTTKNSSEEKMERFDAIRGLEESFETLENSIEKYETF
jgi:hypothetical protein